MTPTQAAIETARALYEAIKAFGERGIPSGELYALCMSKGMSLQVYQTVIDKLVECKMVENKGHLLKALR